MRLRNVALSAFLLAGVACDSTTSPPDDDGAVVADVEITTAAAELSPGERFQFTAAALDAAGSPIPETQLAWSSSNPAVAGVDGDGMVTAAGTGTVEISAAAGDHLATVTLTVVTSWSAIAAGYDHACGLTPGGAVFCWGSNASGQLGTGTVGGSSTLPVEVTGGQTWKAVSAGNRHTCALNADDELWCWGTNWHSELGGGLKTLAEPTPQLVAVEAPFARVRAGNEHTCAVTSDARAYCWGVNPHGQLGNGEFLGSTAPAEVTGAHEWLLVDANGNGMTCGLDLSGGAWCWGTGYLGSEGHTDPSPVPLRVVSDLAFDALGTFFNGGCGLAAGKPYCWGQNTWGTLGTGTTEGAAEPVAASTSATFVHLSVGASHVCALTPAGAAFCWGQNSYGEAGSAPAGGCEVHDCVRSPTAVGGSHEFTTISAGEHLTCAVTAGGAGYCWGRGGEGQLGAGAADDSALPLRVARPPGEAGG